jgi:hypothetical protein
VSPNVNILIDKGLVKKRREGHKMIHFLPDQKKAREFIWWVFCRKALKNQINEKSNSNRKTIEYIETNNMKKKVLKEGTTFVVDKNSGIVTLKKPSGHSVEISYRAGFKKTPADIEKATTILVAGLLKWIIALRKNDRVEIDKIPYHTWNQFRALIKPFTKEEGELHRKTILNELDRFYTETKYLEQNLGLSIFKDYEDLLRSAKEIQYIKKEQDDQKKARNYGWKKIRGEGRRNTLRRS